MRSLRTYLILLSVLMVILASCRKPPEYPVIPSIQYESFYLRDTTDTLGNNFLMGILTFSFRDGDGDIGLRQPNDSVIIPGDPNYSNLFVSLMDYQNGEAVEIPDTFFDPLLYYRIPYIEPMGINSCLEGEVEVEFSYLLFPFDTISYKFHITDRAGNESNTESTPVFIIPKL